MEEPPFWLARFPLKVQLKEGIMLVLTRRRDEAIVLQDRYGKEIRLLVVDVRGNKVRLGIDAPPEISIARKEVHKHGAAVEACARELAWI